MKELKVIENDLVPVYETSTGEKVVYGSELHAVLEVKSQYRDWSRNRIADCGAIEYEDYEAAKILAPSGQTKIDHIIKLDTAKEMAMMERNEKGKQVRRYFIAIEKKYKEMQRNRSLDADNMFRMIELVNKTPSDRLDVVISILRHAGVDCKEATEKRTKRQTDDGNVSDFLHNADVSGRPTSEVYEEYSEYCARCSVSPVSKICFSKMVNRILGTRVIQRKISGRNHKVFVY